MDFYLAMAKASVPAKFYDAELESYTKDLEAKGQVTKYLQKIDKAYEKGIGLYLYGGRGVGKSYLEAVIVKCVLRKGYTALYTDLSTMVSMFGDGFYDKVARDDYHRLLQETNFLIIDDIDKTYINEKSNFVPAAFDQLFRTRANELLPTIVSANKSRKELFSQDNNTFHISAISLLSEHLLDVTVQGTDERVNEISPKIKKEFFDA